MKGKYKNKHEWTYLFRWANRNGNHEYYQITTDEGLEVAEYYAYNNLLWDAGKRHTLKLLTKTIWQEGQKRDGKVNV